LGIIDFVNKFKKEKENKTYAKMLNGYMPIFSQFGQDIYASDVVQQAISCIVFELKKLTPQHVRMNGADPTPVSDSTLQRLLSQPNEKMTTSEFIEKIFWQLFLNYNSFIIPTYTIKFDKDGNKIKSYTGLYPIQPVNVDFLQDSTGKLFVKFKFLNDYETTLRYSDVIHIKYKYSINEFMGGDNTGQPDNTALLKTLELNNTLLEGVSKALKSSFSINGVIKYNTLLDDKKMEKAIKELEEHLKNNESGFLGLDMKGEFIPLQNKIQLVDDRTLKFIDEKILRNFGVSLSILTGDFTKAQYEAFYQKTLEPLIISISQAFTKTLFTDRERGFGNQIKFYPHELIFMETGQKIELFDLLIDSASCFKNEVRVAFGMQPLPELVGQIAMSSNKTNAENNKKDDKNNNINNKDDDKEDEDEKEKN
jgi:phage portal protein